MLPKLENYEEGFGAELICPHCDSMYTHHGDVEVFNRGEDQETGLHVLASGAKATVDDNLDGNPSRRRHSLTICIECESCQKEMTLSIKQHKGATYIDLV